jgi:hypothetical protein
VSGIDGVASATKEEGEYITAKTTTTGISSVSSSQEVTMPATTPPTDPWMIFLYALKAPATKEKYIQRLTKFLDFLGYQGTKEEKARAFAAQARAAPRSFVSLDDSIITHASLDTAFNLETHLTNS